MIRRFRNPFENLFVKTFVAIVLASVTTFYLVTYVMRPVIRDEGFAAHLNITLVQELLNANLKGKSANEINDFLKDKQDGFLNEANIATKADLLAPSAAQKFGIRLKNFERMKLLNGDAFWIGKPFGHYDDTRKMFPPSSNKRELNRNGRKRRTLGDSAPWDMEPNFKNISWQGLVALTLASADPSQPMGKRLSFGIIPIANSPYVIFSKRPALNPPQISALSIALNTALILLILCGIVLWLVYPLVKRLKHIEVTCQKVTTGDYEARCNDGKKDSIGELAQHIDEMTQSIERHLGQQKSLLQAVSHELRTPLSRIRFTIEMLDIPEDDEKSISRLDSIDEDLTEIDNLIKELSYFNYVDAGKGKQHFETAAVKDLIEATLHQRSLALETLDTKVIGLDEDMMIEADPTAFKRVIGNLLSNASRYAQKQIQITVEYSENKQQIRVAVDDDGPGIPEDKREGIFEPFVCLEKSRSKSMTGCGLGLAIADRIMKVHSGSIEAQTSALGGLQMLTIWPVTQDKPR